MRTNDETLQNTHHHLNHIMRKSVLGDFRPGKTQTGLLSYRSWHESCFHAHSNFSNHIIKAAKTKVQIRLRGCAGWSAPLWFAYGINRFSHHWAPLWWNMSKFKYLWETCHCDETENTIIDRWNCLEPTFMAAIVMERRICCMLFFSFQPTFLVTLYYGEHTENCTAYHIVTAVAQNMSEF